MKIAATYENGKIFPHFGKSKAFKIYEVENNKIQSSAVIEPNGGGHGALAGFLAEQGVNVVICGGLGAPAVSALNDAGITVCPGASGDADEAVEAYLCGELTPGEANCSHHHHHEEGHDCTCGDDGCCGHHEPEMKGRNVGKKCHVHYRGTFNDGSQFDSSYDRGTTLDFVCGAGQMIKGFDKAVADMEVGASVDIHLMPEEAYGPKNPNMIITVEIDRMPGAEDLHVGQHVYLQNSMGQPFQVEVTARDEKTITFDANHEMAGKELNFHIELVEVEG